MDGFRILGEVCMISGVVLALLGLLIAYEDRLFPNFRGMPGDIIVKKGKFTFYFPIASSLLSNLILSVIFWFIHKK
jgi:hypothetical protein